MRWRDGFDPLERFIINKLAGQGFKQHPVKHFLQIVRFCESIFAVSITNFGESPVSDLGRSGRTATVSSPWMKTVGVVEAGGLSFG